MKSGHLVKIGAFQGDERRGWLGGKERKTEKGRKEGRERGRERGREKERSLASAAANLLVSMRL